MKSPYSDNRIAYEQPLLRKPTSEQATLFLVGHAYIGNRGAKEMLESVFPERTESELTCDGTCVTRDYGALPPVSLLHNHDSPTD
jgi:hypothetical protein